MSKRIKQPMTQRMAVIWNKTPKDYRSVINGVPYILTLEPNHGTCLTPLEIVARRQIENHAGLATQFFNVHGFWPEHDMQRAKALGWRNQ